MILFSINLSWPIMCWCAIKKLLTHSHSSSVYWTPAANFSFAAWRVLPSTSCMAVMIAWTNSFSNDALRHIRKTQTQHKSPGLHFAGMWSVLRNAVCKHCAPCTCHGNSPCTRWPTVQGCRHWQSSLKMTHTDSSHVISTVKAWMIEEHVIV